MDHFQSMHEWCIAEEGFLSKVKKYIEDEKAYRKDIKRFKDNEKASKAENKAREKAKKNGPPYVAKDGQKFDDIDEMMRHNSFLKMSKEKRRQLVQMIAQEEKRILAAIDPNIRQGFSAIATRENRDFLNGDYDGSIWFVEWDAYDFAKAHNVYPREIWDHDDLAKPLNAAMKFISDEMTKFLKSQNVPFSECDYMGDWDDGSYGIKLKY